MPKVIDAARVTVKPDAVWRTCPTCDQLAAMPPEADHCTTCDPVSLTDAQLSGLACVSCGTVAELMIPTATVPGHGQVFACLTCTTPTPPQGQGSWTR